MVKRGWSREGKNIHFRLLAISGERKEGGGKMREKTDSKEASKIVYHKLGTINREALSSVSRISSYPFWRASSDILGYVFLKR